MEAISHMSRVRIGIGSCQSLTDLPIAIHNLRIKWAHNRGLIVTFNNFECNGVWFAPDARLQSSIRRICVANSSGHFTNPLFVRTILSAVVHRPRHRRHHRRQSWRYRRRHRRRHKFRHVPRFPPCQSFRHHYPRRHHHRRYHRHHWHPRRCWRLPLQRAAQCPQRCRQQRYRKHMDRRCHLRLGCCS